MSEVSQTWRTVLDAMPNGWTTPAAIATRLGYNVEETTDLLAALDEAGLIRVREPEDVDGPVIAISPQGATVIRPNNGARAGGQRDRRTATAGAGAWGSTYDRPSRSRTAVTAATSVVS